MAVLNATSLTGCSSIPDFIATSTQSTFQQTASPTSWTKITSINNYALRVVSGTASSGGTTDFTSVLTSRSVAGTVNPATLSTSQIPSHSHANGTSFRNQYGGPGSGTQFQPLGTGNSGGGGSHTHPFSGTAQDFAVAYVDVILASKD